MKGKLLITAIILSIVLLISGCISSDIPTDKPIVINKDNPTFNVVVKSSSSKVTWTLDGGSPRTDNIGGDNRTTSYLLEYKNIPVGSHTLKVEDDDEIRTWTIDVQGTKEEQAQYNGQQSAGNGSGSHYPTWEEQIEEAKRNN